MTAEVEITVDAYREITIRPTGSGGIVIVAEDPDSVAVVELPPKQARALRDALAEVVK